jgi:hypothetical protein
VDAEDALEPSEIVWPRVAGAGSGVPATANSAATDAASGDKYWRFLTSLTPAQGALAETYIPHSVTPKHPPDLGRKVASYRQDGFRRLLVVHSSTNSNCMAGLYWRRGMAVQLRSKLALPKANVTRVSR